MIKQVISTERIPIKLWLDDAEDGALRQSKNAANLPFAFKHIAIMADCHEGFGVGIGTVLCTKNVIIPYAVGSDISCGMHAVKTDIKIEQFTPDVIKRILGGSKEFKGGIRSGIPIGRNNHSKAKYDDWMPKIDINEKEYPITYREYNNARYALGSMGSNNHFHEFQKDQDGFIWFMIHSGSRNLGYTVADYYNKIAIELNEKYYSIVPKNHELAFLPFDTDEYDLYFNEMTYCMKFAEQNRALMANITKECILEHLPDTKFIWEHDINHNYAQKENHFGENVMVHRKGATLARKDVIGIVPGSLGSCSYITKGLGNPESFMSSPHGAGRAMSRTKAKENLNLEDEIKKLDDQGIIHGIRDKNHLDEATGSYKNISKVAENSSDLFEITTVLYPVASIKG